MSTVLEVKNISKTFTLSRKQQMLERTKSKLKVAVKDLSFYANEGEIFGLLGPNGAGKTTTLRIISTLIKADSGDVLVGGYSVRNQPDQVRGKIGFLTSELKLEDFFTPNYLYDFFSNLHSVPIETAIERKNMLFSKFGIDAFAEVKVSNLSTGMRQKLSLAISLVHDPSIIIFDEPTNGLDVVTAKIVTDYLAELRNEGKCIIVSTHIFSLVERLCDRVGIIIDGKMCKMGTLSEVCGEQQLEDAFFELFQAHVVAE